MKKTLLSVVLGVVFVMFLVWFWITGPSPGKFTVGRALPPGSVTPQLASTADSAILLAPDGSLWGWGGVRFKLANSFPQPTTSITPQRIGSDSDWRKVSASWTFTIALKSDGSLWGWGENVNGKIAQPTGNNFPTPTRIGTNNDWTQISAGAANSLGLRSDGSLWAWGQNEHGQVGDGTTSNKFSVTRISPDNDWRSIAAGVYNGYALKTNGTIWGWGTDPTGNGTNDVLLPRQIDPGTNWVSISAADYELLALKSDGTLWIYGQNAHECASQYTRPGTGKFAQIGTDKDWQEAYAGWSFFFARKRDGSWWVSGKADQGQLGLGMPISPPVAAPRRLGFDFEPWAFAAGYGNCVLLAKDGRLWTWGQRLGLVWHSSRREAVKVELNKFIARIPGHWPQFEREHPQMDLAPYKLWRLPVSVRRMLGKYGEAENQNVTNAAAKSR